MSSEDLLTTAGSAAVVAVLILAVYLMGFRARLRLDDERLAREIAAVEPDARLEAVLVGEDGRAALARLTDGRLVSARVMGDGVSLRSFQPSGAKLELTPGRLSVVFGDPGYPALHVRLRGGPPAWLKDIAA